ncbi:MAG: PAS domain-containing protein [Xanthomonadaceae bacterium]|nr:PAS domain-containing protein [Xanthomonadaceae bacterium]
MNNALFDDPEGTPAAKSHLRFPVVGIGASAGGIAALQGFLRNLPPDSGMAFVVVMHLSPDHESLLGSILERSGRLPVTTVVEATPIQANHLYVISPAMKLRMTDGQLCVAPLVTMEGRRQSIDLFFRSLAQAHRERAVCIVLSGTGNDGAQGIKRVKELGGVALAQSPEDAEFDGMPRAALQTGQVDFSLPVSEMSEKLSILWENAKRIELPDPPQDLEVERSMPDAELLAEEALVSIKALLRERTGHDFAHYKRGTVLRRLERRMQVNALPDLPSYRQLLDSEPNETHALLQDMLISVTNFFRDPQAFAALDAALQTRIAERPKGEPFRAWVAGCATGEEAYSVAIMLRQLLGRNGPPIQLFASDIDQRAIVAARTGLFPLSVANDISPPRLREFFIEENGGYRIAKSIRESVVFSVHNALSDPPFTRLELVCCRNVLIYLDRVAQSQVLNTFHFALKPRGLLFLGSSETADAVDGMFQGIDKTHRVYVAKPSPTRTRILPPLMPQVQIVAPPTDAVAQAPAAQPPLEALHERVLRNYAPPTVLVDADDTVLHVSQRASHLLRLPEGAPSNKLMALARPELRPELRAAMVRAAESGLTVEAPRVHLRVNGQPRTVTITVRPAVDEVPKGLLLVVFDEADESLAVQADGTAVRNPVIDSLEAELLKTQDRLRTTVGESAASTEELRASNEELQTINEELRSTTEELETSREELQAVNEELTTVNGELSLGIDETSKVNDDLHNLMESADIGAVFVDRGMCIKRFTPQASTVFNLIGSDVGRPLQDITHRLVYPQLQSDLAEVMRSLKRVEREVQSHDGRWYVARVAPYRTGDDHIDGVVLVLFDITSRMAVEDQLRVTEQRMALVAQSMRDYAIITMNPAGQIETWSTGAERIFGYEAREVLGQSFAMLFTEEDRQFGKPEEELRKARETARADDDRWHICKDGSRIFCSGMTTPLGDGASLGFAKIARDFTDAELLEQRRKTEFAAERASNGRLQQSSAMKDEFLAVMAHELRNPLSVIHLNTQLWSRLPSAINDPRAVRAARIISAAVASQAQIIEDLLDVSRVNMGKIALDPSMLDLAELTRNVLEAARADAQAKEQALEAQLVDARIFADPVRIEQIVWNLVSNAIKFTPVGGAVRVRLSVKGDVVKLEVTDTGIGLERKDLDRVFDMLHQVSVDGDHRKKGLGIGLALVKQLAELHGGRVQALSQGIGQGSRFLVWLPLAKGETSLPTALPADKGLAGMSLLLVDDEPELLSALGELVESESGHVTMAGDAETALEMARRGSFDAVLSDLTMPGRDGYWLATRLREAQETQHLPLVAVSGMSRASDRMRAMASGFDAHVRKPLDMQLLRAGILEAISRRQRQ